MENKIGYLIPIQIVLKYMIFYTPAADVAQVVHGRWIDCTNLLFEPNKCSVCGGFAYNTENMKYCPNCGAKMDLATEQEEV